MTLNDLQSDIKAAIAVLKFIDEVYPSKVGEDILSFLSGLVINPSLIERLHDRILDDILKKKS